LGADAFDQADLNERTQEVKSALLGNGQRIPDVARGQTLAVAEQLEDLLLFRAQNQLLLIPLRGEFLHPGPDALQSEQESFVMSDGSSMSQVIGQELEVVPLGSGCHPLQ
jgi:hypothetical protein